MTGNSLGYEKRCYVGRSSMSVELVKIDTAFCQEKGCRNKVVYEVTVTEWFMGDMGFFYLCTQHTMEWVDHETKQEIRRMELILDRDRSQGVIDRLEYLNNFLLLGYELKINALLKESKYLAGE